MMRFGRGDTARVIPVRWFFTEADMIGQPTVYSSSFWLNADEWDGGDDGDPGEVKGLPRPIDNSGPPPPCDGPKGSPEAWQGELTPDSTLYRCSGGPIKSAGGGELGGAGVWISEAEGGEEIGGEGTFYPPTPHPAAYDEGYDHGYDSP
jgi:hypothetical protein